MSFMSGTRSDRWSKSFSNTWRSTQTRLRPFDIAADANHCPGQHNRHVRKKTQKNKETAELRKWWRPSWCHHEWKPKAAPVQQSHAQISRFHKPWCQDAPRHQPWKSPAHFQICFPVLHHIGPHLVQHQVFLPAAQDQRSDEEKWPMQPWPRAQQNAPCCQSDVPFAAKLRRTQLHFVTPERQHHRLQPSTDYPLAFEWHASVSMKVRPCGCPEPERLVVKLEHLEHGSSKTGACESSTTCLVDTLMDRSHMPSAVRPKECAIYSEDLTWIPNRTLHTGAPKKLLFLSAFRGREVKQRTV